VTVRHAAALGPTKCALSFTRPPIGSCWRSGIKSPKADKLAAAEFNTIRLRVLKIGARINRIKETAHRVKIAFATACPEATLFRHIMAALKPAPT
jgi:hypothetical protein